MLLKELDGATVKLEYYSRIGEGLLVYDKRRNLMYILQDLTCGTVSQRLAGTGYAYSWELSYSGGTDVSALNDRDSVMRILEIYMDGVSVWKRIHTTKKAYTKLSTRRKYAI